MLEEDDSKESAQDGGEEVNGIDTQIDEIKIVKNSPKYRRKLFSKKLCDGPMGTEDSANLSDYLELCA